MVYGLYVSLVIPLLRSLFYATETEFEKGVVFYYRKSVWSRIRTEALSKFNGNDSAAVAVNESAVGTEETVLAGNGGPALFGQYNPMSLVEVLSRLKQQTMGASQLRLLPKGSGVRGIATLSRRRWVKGEEGGSSSR